MVFKDQSTQYCVAQGVITTVWSKICKLTEFKNIFSGYKTLTKLKKKYIFWLQSTVCIRKTQINKQYLFLGIVCNT
jgi:hypothetical protein